ncbi:MAG: glycosyltransferase family 2 protein [Agathobacter sp.]|nr:glycosyltransferase family 2 protein [Agathobacter sp.]
MIKVSVIIAAYNMEKYMDVCIESLLKQTLEEIELLIVDDGSKDGTLCILKEYEEKYPEKIRVFQKENGGLSSARNWALPHARGEYIGFVDSDDWVDEKMYQLMYETAKKEEADIVVCDIVEHFPDREVHHDYTNVHNKFEFAHSACNKIFRREFAEGITFPIGLWYEDLEYNTKQLMKTENVSVVHEGLYYYNCREGSIMHNNNAKKNKDLLTVMNHVEEFAKINGWEEKYKEELEYLYIDHILLTAINRLEELDSDEKKQVIDELRNAVNEKYPHFYKDMVFQRFPSKRRLVAFLNAKGLSHVSKAIFNLKSLVKKK